VDLVRTDDSEEHSASIIMVTRIDELGNTLALAKIHSHVVFLRSVLLLLVTANVPSSQIVVTLMIKAPPSFETSVLIRSTRRKSQKTAFTKLQNCYNVYKVQWTANSTPVVEPGNIQYSEVPLFIM
jgi:hypothetical protein